MKFRTPRFLGNGPGGKSKRETDKEIDEVKIGLRSAIEARDVKALDAALAKAEAQKDFDESESKWYIEAKRIRDKIVMDAREAGKVTMTRDTTTTHSDTFQYHYQHVYRLRPSLQITKHNTSGPNLKTRR